MFSIIILNKFSCIHPGHTRDLKHSLSRLLLPVTVVINCALNLKCDYTTNVLFAI